MSPITLKVEIGLKVLEHGAGLDLPAYETEMSAGMDLRAAIAEGNSVALLPGTQIILPTGIAISLPIGYEAQVRPRSGLAAKHGLTVLNTPGTIDADYRGEIKVILINLGAKDFVIERGMRIAQMIIAPVIQGAWVLETELDDTKRGAGGFGSTGV